MATQHHHCPNCSCRNTIWNIILRALFTTSTIKQPVMMITMETMLTQKPIWWTETSGYSAARCRSQQERLELQKILCPRASWIARNLCLRFVNILCKNKVINELLYARQNIKKALNEKKFRKSFIFESFNAYLKNFILCLGNDSTLIEIYFYIKTRSCESWLIIKRSLKGAEKICFTEKS